MTCVVLLSTFLVIILASATAQDRYVTKHDIHQLNEPMMTHSTPPGPNVLTVKMMSIQRMAIC